MWRVAMAHSITLIVPTAAAAAAIQDRGQGEQHGLVGNAVASVTRSIPSEQFAAQMEAVIGQVQAIAARLKSAVAEYSADEIKIGLAVSAEGTIGVATAGMEASIEVTLKREH